MLMKGQQLPSLQQERLKNMENNTTTDHTRYIAQAAMIAAIYTVLTMVAAGFDLASGAIQVRFSEALTILPFFTPAAIPGLFVGCILGNLLGGAIPLDVIFGSLATLAGACGTWAIGNVIRRKKLSNPFKLLLPVPPIAANTIVVPLVLYYGYGINVPIPIQMLTVCLGEVISCGVIGMVLFFALEKVGSRIFTPQGT
jgi:uncharacterized membrane protein